MPMPRQQTSRSAPATPRNPEVRQNDALFRLLVEGVRDYAIFMLDPTGHIVTWNTGAERIKGYTADEIIGKHFSIFYTPEDLEREWPAHELRVAVAEGRYEEEGIRVRRDGSRFFAMVVITSLFDSEGQLRGFAKVTRDITERKHAEQELRASEERLRKAHEQLERRVEERTSELNDINQELEAFCYSVSHDLRAPLRGMQGFAAALEEDYGDALDETAKDYLRRIMRASQRMEALIQDLLDYSRLTREEVSLQRLELNDVIDDALLQLAADIERRGASIRVDRPLPEVLASRSVLARVVTNLVSNAIKFVEPHNPPRIAIRAEALRERVRLSVEDNGIGFNAEHQDRIFRVFERLHGVEQYPGTGIGLAIVRKGVERMGGRVGAESEPGRGSRFWIELQRPGGAP